MSGSEQPAWKANYDERQLRIRGDCFQRAFVALCFVLMAEPALAAPDLKFLPVGAVQFALFVGIAWVSTEMIIRDVYFGLVGAVRKRLGFLLLVAVAAMWVWAAIKMVRGPLWASGHPADAAYGLGAALAMTAIPIAMLIRTRADRRTPAPED